MTADDSKTKDQLLQEIASLRQRVAALEAEGNRRESPEETAAAAEDRFRSLFETMNEGVALHEVARDATGRPADYRIIDVNSAFEFHTGIAASRARGRLGTEVYGVPDAPYLAEFEEVARTGSPKALEVYFQPLDKHFHVSAFRPGKDQFATVFTDITARKRMEEALRVSEARQALILHSLPMAFYICDVKPAFGVTWVSEQVQALSGFAPEDFLKGVWESRLHPDDRKRTLEELGRIEENGAVRIEYRWRRPNGEYRWFADSATLVRDETGSPNHIVGAWLDISDRKHADEELRRSEVRYRTLIETAPNVIIVLSPDGRILEFNPEAERVYGASRVGVLGKEYAELFLPPAVRSEVADQLRTVLSGVAVRGYENWIRSASGTERLFVWNADCLRDDQGEVAGVIAAGQDVTEMRRSEETLRLTQYCMDHAAVSTFWIGADAQFLRVNEQACRNLGYTAEELSRMHVYDIDPNFPRDRWPEHWERLRKVKSMSFETVHRRKDGVIYPVGINNNYLEFGGQEFNFSFAHDISERKRAEEERKKLESQVLQAQKLESLGVLAGGIAHDFNNLLMAVLGNAELALQDISEVSPARPMLEEIRRTSRRAADLCRQMLAYSGKGRFVVTPLDLSELVQEMGHMLEVSISKKAAVRYALASALPAVEADATQIRQVIMNLLINASEALGEDSGFISIATGSMECDQSYLQGAHLDENLPGGLYAYLEVSDTGCGMDADTLRRIFDPFFTTKFMGRGLGMAAVLGIVRGHRGAIKVYSEPGKGTTFKILLPAMADGSALHTLENHVPATWKGSGLVLLVDDEETIRLLCQRMLERMGFTVVIASDGVEALEVYRARAQEITCVLLDLTMPNLDGEETFRELRRINPAARVVMSSGYNQQEVVTRFVGKGLAGFVQKPYTIPELTAVMKEVLTSH